MKQISIIAMICFLYLFSCGSTMAAEMIWGPMLQAPNPGEIKVIWEADTAAPCEVRFGLDGQPLDQTASAMAFGALRKSAIISGLQNSSDYRYQVFCDGQAMGEEHLFHTEPNSGEPFSFMLLGDTRSGHDTHRGLIELVTDVHDFNFYVNSGDLIADGEVWEQWLNFFDIEAPALANHVIYPTIGNHDESGGQAELYTSIFDPPMDSSGKEEYYSFDYANVHIAVLDGHVNITPQWLCAGLLFLGDCFSQEQFDWINQDLLAAADNPRIDHIIVVTHAGPYSSKTGRSGSAAMRDLMDEFRAYGVDLVVSGHDHYYERGVSGTGVPYVVTGGGGASLYDIDNDNTWLYPHTIDFKLMQYHYIAVDVSGTIMEFTVYDHTGDVIDSFSIGTRPDCVAATDCTAAPPSGACEGSWECLNFECTWACTPEPPCERDDDCTGDPPPECEVEGYWVCAPDKTCRFVCETPPECTDDADCAEMEPFDDCAGGYYKCEDSVCDWMCPTQPDGDTSDGDLTDGDATDGDVVDGDVVDGDATDGDVADGDGTDGEMTDGDRPVEIDGDVPVTQTDGDSGFAEASGSGSGCDQSGPEAVWLWAALIGILALARRLRLRFA